MSGIPRMNEIEAARRRIDDVIVKTPLVPLHATGSPSGIWLKLEIHQVVNSFKIRGVFNAVACLSDEQRGRGLSTVSAGNTAQALAWCGRHFGVSAKSLMPDSAPKAKIEAVRRYGGEAVLAPVAEVFRFLKERGWEAESFTFIHPWIDRDVMLGHASIGLEILESLAEIDSVFIPVGGGGLLGGVAAAVKAVRPQTRIIAVEPEGCPSLHESLRRGRPAEVSCDTICDGVAVPYMTDEVFDIVRSLVDDCVLVSDDETKRTIKRLALGNRIIVEPSAALSVAAALQVPEAERGLSVCLVTGGSIDWAKLESIMAETS